MMWAPNVADLVPPQQPSTAAFGASKWLPHCLLVSVVCGRAGSPALHPGEPSCFVSPVACGVDGGAVLCTALHCPPQQCVLQL